jgi:hypothetical protein
MRGLIGRLSLLHCALHDAASDMKYAVHTHCKNIAAAFCKKRATRLLETHLQAPITPSERHLERNQMVPGWPRPWNHLVSLQVSLRGSYGSLKVGFQKSSCTLLAKCARLPWIEKTLILNNNNK